MSKIIHSITESKAHVITGHAAQLFRKKGFTATSMKDIAMLMNVEAPSLYNHIAGKHQMLQLICIEVAEKFENHLQKTLNKKTTPALALEELMRFHINMLLTKPNEMFVANHEFKSLKEKELLKYRQRRKAYEQALAELIKKGSAEKYFRKLEPAMVAHTMLAALRGLEGLQINTDKKNVEDNIVALLLNGINQ